MVKLITLQRTVSNLFRALNVKSLFDETALYLNKQYTYNYKFKNKVWRYILKRVLV